MALPRLDPETAYLINAYITKSLIPKGFTEEQVKEALAKSNSIIDLYLPEEGKEKGFDICLAAPLNSLEDFNRAEKVVVFLETRCKIDNTKFPTVVYPGAIGTHYDAEPKDRADEKGDIEKYLLENSKSLLVLDAERMSFGSYTKALLTVVSNKPAVLCFNDTEAAEDLKVRNPLKTIGTVERAFGFHITADFDQAVRCLQLELHVPLHSMTETDRAANHYCDSCKSLILRNAYWLSGDKPQTIVI